MAHTVVRERKSFGKHVDATEMPNLLEVQLRSYHEFLQPDVEPTKRKKQGLQRIFMDIAGRYTPVARGYSQAAFLKDNPEEVLDRLKKWQKQASVITRELEDKARK